MGAMARLVSASVATAVALAVFAPATAQQTPASQGEACELHVWGTGWVPDPNAPTPRGNAFVRITPPDYSNPYTISSLLEARQRVAEIDPQSLKDHFVLDDTYTVVLHLGELVPLPLGEKGTRRLSDSASPCYADFLLRAMSLSAGKRSFSYRYYFRDFGNDNVVDLNVKGGRGAELKRWDEDKDIDFDDARLKTAEATDYILRMAGTDIQRRRARGR